ncbi:hypothetical protein EYR36_011650 [Pleurotus pulmonarius]|nr:hypothetical protein EYR36_011650 [Pleurotus pulmonarius]
MKTGLVPRGKQLPPELVQAIITQLVPHDSDDNGWTTLETIKTPSWTDIRSCTLASKMLRGFSLAAWFRVLVLKEASDVAYCTEVLPLVLEQWTRELFCLYVGKQTVHDISGFKRLTRLYLDFTNEPRIWTLPFLNAPTNLTELHIGGHGWLTPMNLCVFASSVPELRTLQLQLKRVWCHLCNLCNKVQFAGFLPESIVYKHGLGLPIHYSNVLSPCRKLRKVVIAVAYTTDGSTTIGSNEGENPNFWAGECDGCMNLMYKSDKFREKWVSSKKETIHARPPALETVEWQFHPIMETSSTASDVSTSDVDGDDSGTANSAED